MSNAFPPSNHCLWEQYRAGPIRVNRASRFAVRWLLRDPANVLVPTNLKSKLHNRSELLSNHHICCEFCAAFGLLPPSYGRQRPTPSPLVPHGSVDWRPPPLVCGWGTSLAESQPVASRDSVFQSWLRRRSNAYPLLEPVTKPQIATRRVGASMRITQHCATDRYESEKCCWARE